MNMGPESDRLPAYFNSSEKWPGKIHEPLDQGNCGASWAFSTAGRIHDENPGKYGMVENRMKTCESVTNVDIFYL